VADGTPKQMTMTWSNKSLPYFYAQAVIQHPHGVVFLTCEAPFVDGADQSFRDLLGMIHES